MGRKEKIALAVTGGIIFLIIIGKGYGIWAVVGVVAFWWYRKKK